MHTAQKSCRPLQFSTECWQASQAWLSFPVLNCCHRSPNFITEMSLDACKNSWKQGVGANLIGCTTGHGCVKRGSKRKEKELPSETAATTETVKIIKYFILSLLLHLKTCSQSQGGPLYLAEMWSVLVKKNRHHRLKVANISAPGGRNALLSFSYSQKITRSFGSKHRVLF